MPASSGAASLPDARYRLFETRQFLSDLDRLDPSVRTPLRRKLETYVYPQLAREPHVGPNIQKLRGWRPETWRYRIGVWRFFYEIDEESRTVALTTLDHRGQAYR